MDPQLLLFSLPFLILFGGVLALRRSVLFSASISTLVLVTLLFFSWQMPINAMAAALVKASLITFDIALILIAALLLVEILKTVQALAAIKQMLASLTPDIHLQALVVAIFFVGLIEGLAGFGTPAILAAPILAAIGYPVPTAILLTLVGNTLTVPFGAAGTPILIGLTQGVADSNSFLTLTIQLLIAMSIPLAVLIPLFLSIVAFSKQHWQASIIAGGCFAIPYGLIAVLLGPEFPALLGSLIGGVLFVTYLRLRGKAQHSRHSLDHPLWYAFVPYTLTVLLLIASRLPSLPFQAWLQSWPNLEVHQLLSIPVSHQSRPLYSPGFFLLIGATITAVLYQVTSRQLFLTLRSTAQRASKPIVTLSVLIFFSQLLIFSGFNTIQNPSLPVFAAQAVSQLPIAWPLLAPFVGLFGSLVTGSVTVSNLLFSSFQAQTADLGGYSLPLILALQVLGAAAGNMIALHNIVAVLAVTTDKRNKITERTILRQMIKPALLYAGVVAVMGWVLARTL